VIFAAVAQDGKLVLDFGVPAADVHVVAAVLATEISEELRCSMCVGARWLKASATARGGPRTRTEQLLAIAV